MTFVERLAAIVGDDHLIADAAAMAPYLTDWRGRYRGAARCIVRPGSTAEVAAVVAACHRAGAPMLPQGGNTSLVGAATPDGGGATVVISLARLDRIRRVDVANHTITAEAGCTLAAVQAAAVEVGRLFPLSLASEGSCHIGGNLSTNAGGVQVLRYGNARELTLGLEVVLPDGRVWDGLKGLRKDNTGYDLKHWFIGAEGTLGLITAAVLKLFPQPRATAVAWVALPTAEAAIELLGAAQDSFDARLTAFELVSDVALGLVLENIPGAASPLAARQPWYALIELDDIGGEVPLRESLETFVAAAIDAELARDAAIAASLDQARRLWHLRESISEAQKIEGVSIKHDVSVPVSSLPAFLERAGNALAAAFPGIRVVAFGHAGDGNLHYNLSKPEAADNAAFLGAQDAVNRLVHDLVHDLGGSISAEHGIGQLKREELLRYATPLEMELMRGLKKLLDPRGLMNPGKVV